MPWHYLGAKWKSVPRRGLICRVSNHLLYLMLQVSQRSTLPCIFISDFNCKLEELAIWPSLQQHGWVDIALHFQNLTGLEPEPTWNGQTRIDFALVPNQIPPWFRNLEINHDTISYHSKLILTFESSGGPIFRTLWKSCRDSLGLIGDRKVEDIEVTPCDWNWLDDCIRLGNVTSACKAFTNNFEDWLRQVHSHIANPFPIKAFLGRGNPSKIQKPIYLPVIPQSRREEETPIADDAPIRLRQQVKQSRRILSCTQQLQNYAETNSQNSLLAAHSTWVAVLHAKGFPGGFAHFCS